MDGGSGGGVLSVTIESEVRLKFFFGHFIENAAEDSCRAGMISREDLDGEYDDRVFGCEDSNSDMDMSDDDM